MEPEELTITTDWRRFEFGLWECKEGDIRAAYSADRRPKIRPPFTHDGKTYTNMGCHHGTWRTVCNCHELLPFTDEQPAKVPYSHEGEAVEFRGKKYRLGPQINFVATERTVEEYQQHFLAAYKNGGAFTSNKTYHDVLRDWLEKETWDSTKRAYVLAASDNCRQAIALELAKPDFTKHKPQPIEPELHEAIQFALGMI